MIEYLTAPVASSAPYAIGHRVVKGDRAVLTVADMVESPLFGLGRQSDAFDDAETRAVESNPTLYATIVQRLATPSTRLVPADEVL